MEVRPGYKQTEVGIIPDDWEVHPVRQMGDVVTGKALAVNAPGELRPYLRTKNVFDGRIVIDDVLTMPMTDEQFAHFRLRNGDVLLNEGQSLELVGRCSLYADEYPQPCAIQNQLLRFRARAGVSGVFASYLFRRCQETGVFAKIALQTTSIAHLGGSRFGRLLLAWPREEREQQAIAAALSDVDALLGGLDRLIAKKRDLKQAAMQQLLTGQTRLPGFQGDWEVKLLGELGTWRGGMTPSMHNPSYWAGGDMPWISSGDVKVSRLRDTSQHVTTWAVRQRAAVVVPANSIVLVTRSGILRKFLPVALTDMPMAINQDIKALTPSETASSEYLLHALAGCGDQILARCLKAGTTVESIEFPWLKAFAIPIPPRDEQAAIAAVLTDMDAELSVLEARRDKTRDLKRAMMQELLTGRTRLL